MNTKTSDMDKKQDNKVIKAGVWYTISNFIVKGITFISMPIFTRIMSPEDIGIYSNIASWVVILVIITTFNLQSALMLAKYDYKEDINSFISSNLLLSSGIVTLFYILTLIFPTFFENLLMMDRNIINLIFVYLFFCSSIDMLQVKNRFEYKYKLSTLISIGSSVFSVVISLICTLIYKENALLARIYGFYIPQIIVYALIYFYFIIKGRSIKKEYCKYALIIAIPTLFHLLSMNILNTSDRIMITKLINSDSTAFYTIAYTTTVFVTTLWGSMNNAWAPWTFDMLDEKKYNTLKSKSKPYFLFFLLIVYIYILIAPEILFIMGGKQYMHAVYVIPPVMVADIFKFVYSLYVNIEAFYKKQKLIALGTILAAISNIILNYIFIPLCGYIAAAYTTLISFILLFIFHSLLVKKIKRDYYDKKFFLKFLLISIAIIPIVLLLYKFNLIRYILISVVTVLIIIFLLKNRKIIIESIKTKDYETIIGLMKK